MGILDDAIREHIELRRRNGADAEELRRLEQSLLSDAPAVADEPEFEAARPAATEPEQAAAPEPEPLAAEPDPPAPAAARELTPVEQPTRQFSAAELEAAEAPLPDQEPAEAAEAAEPGEHDELEETPDFLQETPEHDRLWFEQKPPKDFDF